MPEPLKNLYSKAMINAVADRVFDNYADFDRDGFMQSVFAPAWPSLELKQRMQRVCTSLHNHLPDDFSRALPILINSCCHFNGFEYMFFPQYVERYGQRHFELSMSALQQMTEFASAEFAVRPFIISDTERMHQQLLAWSQSPNHHVRRLASEGCRPRLPWAIALPAFKRNPSPIMPILQNLLRDPSEYVRRSVANNLNDISKDNPGQVINLTRQWLGQHADTDRLLKHACRTLLKQGNPDILDRFGFAAPEHIRLRDFTCTRQVRMGETLAFRFSMVSPKPLGRCRLEYRIHFKKANGRLAPVIFKISESTISTPSKMVTKNHAFRAITTRHYYPGRHALEIVINGRTMARKAFQLAE